MRTSDVRHVVWDWNGTLLDDLPIVVDAVNHVMAAEGLPPIDAPTYTATYTRPVRRFYERLYGRPVGDVEWVALDEVFHTAYDAAVTRRPTLADDAHAALDHVEALGLRQSLLSMYRHEQLVPLLDQLDLRHRFDHVQGLTGPGGGPKLPHLTTHLEAIAHDGPADRVLVVGDALDDAAAAAAVGARCVLVASGSHPRGELLAAGVPVVDRLLDALPAATSSG